MQRSMFVIYITVGAENHVAINLIVQHIRDMLTKVIIMTECVYMIIAHICTYVCVLGLGNSTIVIYCHDSRSTIMMMIVLFYYCGSSRHDI